ncbi:uncharacterized protein LOC116027200 isoform X2 [Ipomoea triloba]|uniref:uncharacterized protein LOC116027200 isoform X2 n=1 Tax=Ipomoea triloba TaxID=35885 RepID=UPI00125CDB1A|nr:uncharacterized protein LOC116027200 isoform X2 [Ipomoea triloba]XP_031124539.1 uncharacterized protein LOC116027200 isoform X2 [Ipomoea triloba]
MHYKKLTTGVKCAVLEKSKVFSTHPQAHFINNRSMEVFRKMDGLAEEILSSQPPVEFWRKFIYCTSLTGPILGSVDHMQPEDFDHIVSPVSVAHFSQYKLTRLMLKQLKELDFHIRNYEGFGMNDGFISEKQLLMGHECTAINPSNHFITVTASFPGEGKSSEKSIRCQFLVGTDGAASTARKLMGINMKGEKNLQKLISVHFMSQELGQYLINERPGMLFFIFNEKAIGVLVAHNLEQGEFVLQIPFYPPQQRLEDFSSEMHKIIYDLVGKELADIKVIDIKPWVMHAEVAEKFLSCGNRIILAGDAAHRFPPAGGFGMNTGIQDAHNIAWKLALVSKGIAPASFLSTYEAERKQIATFNTILSVQNFKAAMRVPAALGLDPTIANAVHQALNNTVGSILPSGVQKTILDGIFSIGRAQLSDIVLNPNNPLGSARLARLREIFEEGQSLQLQFPAEDLGFRYLKGALVSNGDNLLHEPEAPTGRRRDFVPSADPGSRLPHINVRPFSNPPSKETFSTLDLVSAEKVEFLLIIAPVDSSYHLALAAFQVAEDCKVPLKVCVMWPGETIAGANRSKAALLPWENFVDVLEVKRPPNSSSWWGVCKMTDRGAILVRPDEHIAWRTKSELAGDATTEMRKVFHTILGSQCQMMTP